MFDLTLLVACTVGNHSRVKVSVAMHQINGVSVTRLYLAVPLVTVHEASEDGRTGGAKDEGVE